MFENDRRPAWLNWVFLGMFLWSSWQLFGFGPSGSAVEGLT
ncbi:MAG: hypothetical protein CM15mP39_09640 [Synechococcus sp.]|nr:MAG: hypothetical protein CM15mP39_09640 [Synechococcus sp.]